MAHEQHRAVFHEFTQKTHALLGKKHVTYSKCFVHDQNVGIYMRNDGKGQANHHATGISLHRLSDKIPDIGKGKNIVKARINFFVTQTQDRGIHVDIFPPGKLRVKA
ncbi:hypothetical protein GALL_432540 [mine drainage metagenome]|uniref:Uncharacterized protein n=1 Tax=mine drainage metagenome TaxID=410659 RepID=A0A1J5PTY3_9ZZZZ